MSRVAFRATYRLQLTPDFGFAAARELIPYLCDLGISHLYLSPSLQARAGSLHGYDVVDPTRVSSDLGGEDGLRRLAAAAHEARMGLILDIVQNRLASSVAMWLGTMSSTIPSPAARAAAASARKASSPPRSVEIVVGSMTS